MAVAEGPAGGKSGASLSAAHRRLRILSGHLRSGLPEVHLSAAQCRGRAAPAPARPQPSTFPKRRSKGVIVNISSFTAINPTPLLTVYSATKAFVDYFSQGLSAEYKNKGIIVQSVQPYFVATKMTKIRKPSAFKPTPEDYVKYALNTVGLETQTSGCPTHALAAWFSRLVPKWYFTKMALDTNLKIRAHNLKKLKAN